MNNKIGFGSFNSVIPSNKAYRNFRVLEQALKNTRNEASIIHKPFNIWNFHEVEISHPSKKFEKKLQKAMDILLKHGNEKTPVLYSIAKLLKIPKKTLAEASDQIGGIVYHSIPAVRKFLRIFKLKQL